MRKNINILFLAICFFVSPIQYSYSQQIKNLGLPFIKNYSPEVYKASDQNWTIYQDERGIFYFGNTLGILEFDGISWRLTELPNRSTVRSICPDKKGKIFIGGSDEIGYLVYDSVGNTKYKSLINLIPEKYKNFGDVWEIFSLNDEIIFRTYQYIFILQNENITTIIAPNEFRTVNLVKNEIYITDDNGEIYTIQDNKLKLFLAVEKLTKKHHPIILPFDNNKLLFATRKNGLFIYDGKKITEWNIEINDFLKKNLLYCAIQIDSNYYAFGTWLNGVIITDKKGKPIQFLNKENGLISNNIYNFYVDKQKNLWCALDGGIAQIEINSPFSYVPSSGEFQVQCFAFALFKNTFYVGGSPHIFYRDWVNYEDPFNRKPFVKIKKTEPQLWQLHEIDGELYGAHSFDILKIDKNNVTEIPVNDKIVWDVNLVNGNTQFLIAGEDDGIYVLKKEKNSWKLKNKISGYNDLARWIVVDKNNNFWCSTYGDRIYKLTINNDFDSITSTKFYDIKPNYPLAIGNRVTIIDNKIIVAGSDGFYIYNEIHDNFESYNEFNNLISKGYPVNITGCDKKGNFWFTDFEGTGEFLKQPNGHYTAYRTPFYKFNNTSESYPIFTLNDSNIIIGSTNGFIHYDPTYKKDYNLIFNTLIRKVELLNCDSLIYNGGETTQIKTSKPSEIIILYKNNSIRFEYTATSYENVEKNQFQYKLIGYDKNWSNWSTESKKEYTNLPEGNYTFTVRSRNVYRVIGTTSKFDFQIQAPWYRTIGAFLCYFLFIVLIIYLIVYLNSRRLIAANLKLESIINDRTIEIVNQKEEILMQYEQVKENNALKDKFYSIISHDLINTIGSLRSFSDLLKKYVSNKNDEKLNKYSKALFESSKSAFELLINLLNWTRLQTGRIKVNPEKVNFIDLVNEGLILHKNSIENKKLTVEVNNPEELYIYADRNMMSTVLRNLISNAIKFTPENGKISIIIKNSDAEYMVDIADTGIGISEDDLKKLFRNDIYFQRHGTNNETGTGLGLLLIKSFIELHNGKISIESETNKGSKFSFIVPLNFKV